jgi:uncharacterized membrane protein YphA (DoxX/SURF4 family)
MHSESDRPRSPSPWIEWPLRLIPAAILGQTLWFKFTADPSAVALFTTLGVEPWGRIFTGVLEALAVLLLLIPSTGFLGAALTVGLMAGALFSHLTVLGIEIEGDGGLLFGLAVVSALAGAALALVLRRSGLARLRTWGLPAPAWLG